MLLAIAHVCSGMGNKHVTSLEPVFKEQPWHLSVPDSFLSGHCLLPLSWLPRTGNDLDD